MSEKVLPPGQQWINMRGEIKTVAKHLAFDRQLQKQHSFFPCDENGVQINQTDVQVSEPQKKIADVAVVEPVIEIPKGLDIVNPDDAVELNEDKLNVITTGSISETATITVVNEANPSTQNADIVIEAGAAEPKKRGRKPNTQNQ